MPSPTSTLGFNTLSLRAGTQRSEFREHAEALFLSSSFVHESAEMAAARFADKAPGHIYSRFSNPTVDMFSDRLAAMEGAEMGLATSTGMSAILVCMMGLLNAGDHVICSSGVFGSVVTLLEKHLSRFGIQSSFVPSTQYSAWESAVRPNTRLLFCETPTNPALEVIDIPRLSTLAHQHQTLLVVDNCFCTPAIQRPLSLGADIVVHSATKFLEGQGRVLGGAILGPRSILMGNPYQFLRCAGPSISPFNAWVILKGLETLSLRMNAQSAQALAIAQWLQEHPAIAQVRYPGLPSHPQHAIALAQQSASGTFHGGAIVSFNLKGGQAQAWHIINQCQLLSITANIGDTKTILTHPASTTHARISPEARTAAGVDDSLLRLSVGLEDLTDIKTDLLRGLDSLPK